MVEDGSSIKKVLVTGGSGFIGTHLVARLLTRGHEISCLLRREKDRTPLRGLDIRPLPGRLGDPDSLERAVQGVEAICHLAGETKGPGFWRVNAQGTANLVAAVAKAAPGLKRFVHLSSLAAQGPGRPGRALSESDPANPISAYGRSKLAGEEALGGLPGQVRVTVLRAPIIYGPGGQAPLPLVRAVRAGFLPLVCGPEQKFSLLHVADLVRVVTTALEEPAGGGTFLLSDGEPRTLAQLAQAMARILKVRYRAVPVPRPLLGLAGLAGDGWSLLSRTRNVFGWDKFLELGGPNWEVDCSLARERLGFAPEYHLERGFAETLGWYAEKGLLRAF